MECPHLKSTAVPEETQMAHYLPGVTLSLLEIRMSTSLCGLQSAVTCKMTRFMAQKAFPCFDVSRLVPTLIICQVVPGACSL